MGFDINVMMTMYMCNQTGKPYYYGKGLEKIYELPSLTIPKDLVPYITERGSIFHAYTEYFNDQERYDVNVEEFLDHYPSWDDVQNHSSYEGCEDWWTKDYHSKFEELLTWCTQQCVSFRVSWSY